MFNPKNGGQSKEKRNLNLADESGNSIALTLWGKNAVQENFDVGQVIAIRGAKVSDYNGKTLNSGHENSQIYINIEHKRTKQLQTWF